jgi:uncharacterized protein (DUF1330 family)
MPHELVIAMNVTDPQTYSSYRAGMTPILIRYGGGFRYDMEVSRVFASPTSHPITRLFAIFFRDRPARDAFFADPEYLRVREQLLTRSIDGYTVVAEHDRP